MSNRTYSDGEACTDCMTLLVNGEVENPDPRWDEEAAKEAMEENDITPNMPDEEDSFDEFSRSTCDICGTAVAGSRHPVAIWED